jgi:hypothetical protein
MHIEVKLVQTRKLGLEVYRVYVNGLLYCETLSANMARTKALLLLNKPIAAFITEEIRHA